MHWASITRFTERRTKKQRSMSTRRKHASPQAQTGSLKEVKVGGELYGGLGDSTLGPTLNPDVTQQYAELNLKTEFNNGLHVIVGAPQT